MSYPGAGIVGGTHFVLSKHMGRGIFRPDIVFTMFLPPTGISLDYRMPHMVTAGYGSVHVDSGRMLLADLSVEVNHGVGVHLYTNAKSGLPMIMNGLRRSRELRAFLTKSSTLIAARTHRLEFHNEKRKIHTQIIPTGSHSHEWRTGASGRIGGGESKLTFTVVRDLKKSIDPLAVVDNLKEAANDAIGTTLGAAALYVNMMAVSINRLSPASAFRELSTSFVNGMRIVFRGVGNVLNEINRHTLFSMELDRINDARNLIRAFQTDVLDKVDDLANAGAGHKATGHYYNQLKYQIDALDRVMSNSAKKAGSRVAGTVDTGSSFEQAAALSVEPDQDIAHHIRSTQDAQMFSGYFGLGAYKGWQSHVVKKGETLQSIAMNSLGETALWKLLASINGVMGNPFIYPGMVLKVPVMYGGYSFSVDEFSDQDAMKNAMFEEAYMRDLYVKEVPGASDAVDLVLTEDLMDIKTVTGPDNYMQRYKKIVFKTELGENPEFPSVGVVLGIGEKMLAGKALMTKLSAQAALLGDPRTKSLIALTFEDLPDGVRAAFSVHTTSSLLPSNLLIGGV